MEYKRGVFFVENGAAHSSNRQEWGTPQKLYDQLNKEFGFTLDVCATSENAKHKNYFTPEIDGLNQNWWNNVCFMNPPFNRFIGLWVKKAYESALNGAVVVALIPARTDTKYWHAYIEGKAEVRFIKGRLKYEIPNNKTPYVAPFPSCVVIWRRN